MTIPDLLQSSNPNLIEARRRNTLSKMKGLVIPENGTTTSDGVAESISAAGAKNSASAVTLSAPPWKAVNGGGSGGLNCSGAAATLPKYSPAFKRKPFTIYTSENIVSKSSPSPQTQAAQTVKETAATKGS